MLADYDIKSLKRQAKATTIRLDIANEALNLHKKSIDQIQEFFDLTDGKFTSHGLYVWLSVQLQNVYRAGYQNTLAVAKLAEQAYRFERGDDRLQNHSASYWDQSKAGLLAGEKLLVDLQTLERRFLETNYRMLEIDQSFSLSQIDPKALVELRETQECNFKIAEVYFDLFYPGQYKRRIKAVRLTIPCITGPYANVSATLTLSGSHIRLTSQPNQPLVDVPPSRSIAIAASTARNDAGVFEMSFSDERYMPFEGLGAISRWNITLPKAFKQFDYQTINDVIISISYTSEQDGTLREHVEKQNAELEGTIVRYLTENAASRLFSLRQDFPNAFSRLTHSVKGTQVSIEISDRNFPLFLQGRKFIAKSGTLLLRSQKVPDGFVMTIDGKAVKGFKNNETLGNLPGAIITDVFSNNLCATHTLTIDSAGDLAPTSRFPDEAPVVDPGVLEDILINIEYVLTSP